MHKPGKGTYANTLATGRAQRYLHTAQKQHTCSAHERAQTSKVELDMDPLVSSHHCLLACILLLFVFCQIPGIRHISYFHHRRQPCGPAALQKSKVLSKTPVPFQNPVMCYNVARSRMLYLSSDCHFLYISVIQLMCRGLEKGLLGD